MRNPRRSPAVWLGLALAALAFAPGFPQVRTRTAPLSPELRVLAETRYQASLKQYDEVWRYYQEARINSWPVHTWSITILNSRLELCDNKTERIAAYEAHQARMLRLEALVRRIVATGKSLSADIKAVDYYHAEAAYLVARERAS